jgi:hypothetical protein
MAMVTITVADKPKDEREKFDLYGVLNALENTLGSAPFEARKALQDTVMDYSEDCPLGILDDDGTSCPFSTATAAIRD